jgi:predicted lipid-binding transport protein (Tim44 family)
MTPAPQPGAAATRPGVPPAAAQPARGGFMGGLAGGLLAGGLIGLMFGGGLFGAGFAGFLGALLQIGLIALLVFFVIRLFRRRAQPAGMARDMQPPASPLRGYAGGAQPQPAAAAPPVQIDAEDFDAFERLLTDVQDAWSRQDRDKMQRIATPEMVTLLGEQIGELRAKGLTNRVRDVKLEQGDLAEAWQERGRTFATVAMRFSMVAETTDASGRVVEGGPQRQEATELWTFVRVGAGDWMLSAIQQAA